MNCVLGVLAGVAEGTNCTLGAALLRTTFVAVAGDEGLVEIGDPERSGSRGNAWAYATEGASLGTALVDDRAVDDATTAALGATSSARASTMPR